MRLDQKKKWISLNENHRLTEPLSQKFANSLENNATLNARPSLCNALDEQQKYLFGKDGIQANKYWDNLWLDTYLF